VSVAEEVEKDASTVFLGVVVGKKRGERRERVVLVCLVPQRW
jgi:hypothetical protein